MVTLVTILLVFAIVLTSVLLAKNKPDNTDQTPPAQVGLTETDAMQIFSSASSKLNTMANPYLSVEKQLDSGHAALCFDMYGLICLPSNYVDFATYILNAHKSDLYSTRVELGKTYKSERIVNMDEKVDETTSYYYDLVTSLYYNFHDDTAKNILVLEAYFVAETINYTDSTHTEETSRRTTMIIDVIINEKYDNNKRVTSMSNAIFTDSFAMFGLINFTDNTFTLTTPGTYETAGADYKAGEFTYEKYIQNVGNGRAVISTGVLNYDMSSFVVNTDLDFGEVDNFNNVINSIRMTDSINKIDTTKAIVITSNGKYDPIADVLDTIDHCGTHNLVLIDENNGKYRLENQYISYDNAKLMINQLADIYATKVETDSSSNNTTILSQLQEVKSFLEYGQYAYAGSYWLNHESGFAQINIKSGDFNTDGVVTCEFSAANCPVVNFTFNNGVVTLV